MTAIGITGMGLTGVVRMTWVQDDLAHVLEHARTDETPGTWTGRACPDYALALGGEVVRGFPGQVRDLAMFSRAFFT